ncbi:MAG: AlpA family phage regulatory protein [Gemmatimonadota bacterium]|nr:AlpA family phage regulatory protein [Gemmatimonadota bacterium]
MLEILRCSQVERIVGVSKTTIYRLMRQGRFPRPRRLSKNAVGWPRSEVEEWLENRPLAGGDERPPQG